MSQRKLKQFRRQLKKGQDKILLKFLEDLELEPLLYQIKIAKKIILKGFSRKIKKLFNKLFRRAK
jgi:hypothetical protein